MRTIKLDLHGHNISSAILAVENFIASSQEIQDFLHLKVITGHGKIKEAIIKFLEEEDYDYFVPISNDGMVVIEIPEDI